MPRLIWVFAEHATCHFVGFVMHWLIRFRCVLYGLPMAKTFYRRTAKTVIRLGRMPRLNAQADLCLCWPHKSFEPVYDKTNKNDVHPAKTRISLGIRPVWSGSSLVWSETSLSAGIKLKSLATHSEHSDDWSDWADAQTDLSHPWADRSFCWFCHALADQSSMCALWVANGKNFLQEDSKDCDQTRTHAQAECPGRSVSLLATQVIWASVW